MGAAAARRERDLFSSLEKQKAAAGRTSGGRQRGQFEALFFFFLLGHHDKLERYVVMIRL